MENSSLDHRLLSLLDVYSALSGTLSGSRFVPIFELMGFSTKIMLILLLFIGGTLLGGYLTNRIGPDRIENVHVRFLTEIYDEVKVTYWQKISEKELSIRIKDAVANYVDKPQALDKPSRQDVVYLLRKHLLNMTEPEDRKKFVTEVAQNFLNALPPAKRSHLFNNEGVENLSSAINRASTIFASKVHANILYLRILSFSPNTHDELLSQLEMYEKDQPLNTMVLDLRANSGGAITVLPKLLGAFIGKGQYAYEFQTQSENEQFKTTSERPKSIEKYKKVIILINERSQSSAELMASVLKKYNVGVLVGKKTNGWGTVERVQKIRQELDVGEYNTLYLVHAVMLDADGKPIEGRGIIPDIDISKKGWDTKLFAYFHFQILGPIIQKLWQAPPH